MVKTLKLVSIGILFLGAVAMAILSGHIWHWMVALALAFSWLGDALLAKFYPLTRNMADPFVPGMGAFAIAQVFYGLGFWFSMQGMLVLHARVPGQSVGAELLTSVLPVYLLVGVFAWLLMIMRKDRTWDLKIAALVYDCLLCIMAALAFCAAFTGQYVAWPLIAGGLLFMISDGFIASRVFADKLENEKLYQCLVWGTYLPAQLLLLVGSSWLY